MFCSMLLLHELFEKKCTCMFLHVLLFLAIDANLMEIATEIAEFTLDGDKSSIFFFVSACTLKSLE